MSDEPKPSSVEILQRILDDWHTVRYGEASSIEDRGLVTTDWEEACGELDALRAKADRCDKEHGDVPDVPGNADGSPTPLQICIGFMRMASQTRSKGPERSEIKGVARTAWQQLASLTEKAAKWEKYVTEMEQ